MARFTHPDIEGELTTPKEAAREVLAYYIERRITRLIDWEVAEDFQDATPAQQKKIAEQMKAFIHRIERMLGKVPHND